ncbi:hypothetical protein XFF6991_180138 [Xanthomonas phaseoli pv. phaseoli]|uniref:Uncharacterized protein n=1 Tax=Xanthomonas campestris pv. phaseoli TaxID=317013 RepID=A0A7Z7IWR6_XANCH|nr:hypothetical protein XFF6991_180138 [Xanthomonas phaseoli pv. phaseoli]
MACAPLARVPWSARTVGAGRGAERGRVRVWGEATAIIRSARGFARTLIRPTGTFSRWEKEASLLLLLA